MCKELIFKYPFHNLVLHEKVQDTNVVQVVVLTNKSQRIRKHQIQPRPIKTYQKIPIRDLEHLRRIIHANNLVFRIAEIEESWDRASRATKYQTHFWPPSFSPIFDKLLNAGEIWLAYSSFVFVNS